MGGHHSKCHCNTGYYQNKIKNLQSSLNSDKSQIEDLTSKLANESKRYNKCMVNTNKLEQVCMVPNNETIKETGERIYNLLNTRYKENIKLVETQQRLMDRYNRSLGKTDVVLSEQQSKLKRLNDKITTNDQQLLYNNQLYHRDNIWIRGLKITAVFFIVALIGVMILSAFKTLKKK
jgi:hypothetical protein